MNGRIPRSIGWSAAVLLATLCMPLASQAAEGAMEDVQNVILLAPMRPILLRLHIHRGEESCQVVWGKRLLELFHKSDLDGSGDLDDEEFSMSRVELLIANRRDINGRVVAQNSGLVDVDVRPVDARVSLAEFIEAFGQAGITSSDGGPSGRRGLGDDPLFGLLDNDGQAGISVQEAFNARQLIASLDSNDDECLSLAELRPEDDFRRNGTLVRSSVNREQARSQVGLILVPLAQTPPASIARILLEAYDTSSGPADAQASPIPDGRLLLEEIELGSAFKAFDADHSGSLEETELAAWITAAEPDAELAVRLGSVVPVENQLVLLRSSGDLQFGEATTNGSKKVTLTGARVRVELAVQADNNVAQALERDKQRFNRGDQDKNGYLDRDEYPRSGFGRESFAGADRDGNGQIFIEEQLAYQEMILGLSNSGVTIAASDQGSTLVEILDTRPDARLTPRELGSLTGRLPVWDRDNNGQVTPAEIPRQFSLVIGPIVAVTDGLTFVSVGEYSATASSSTSEGPVWFQRMDRNTDRDVSRREFLGSLEMFEQADVDRDDLLSSEEASAIANP